MNSFRLKLGLLIMMVLASYQLACWTVAGVRSHLRRSSRPSFAEWFFQITGLAALIEFLSRESDESAFLRCAFSMLALMAKADGRVSEAEINRLEEYIRNTLRLSDSRRKDAITCFRHALKSQKTFEQSLNEFYDRFYANPALLHSMAGVLSELALADGNLSPAEERLLNLAVNTFGFNRQRFSFGKRTSGNEYEQRERAEPQVDIKQDPLTWAYQTLGCNPDAALNAIKRAYRKLAKEHHPDRVVARGLPPEFVHHAEERFKKIQRAYDEIMQARAGKE